MSVLQRTDQVPIHRTKQENLIHASKTELEGGGGLANAEPGESTEPASCYPPAAIEKATIATKASVAQQFWA